MLLEMNGLIDAVTMLGLLSVATERVVSITGVITKIDERITNSKMNGAAKQAFAGLVGGAIYAVNIDSQIPLISHYLSGFSAPIFVGLMVSGGSGFWNSALKIMQNATKKIEQPPKE